MPFPDGSTAPIRRVHSSGSGLLPSDFQDIGARDAPQIQRLSDEYIIDFDGCEKTGNRV